MVLALVVGVGTSVYLATKDGMGLPGAGANDQYVEGLHDARTGEDWNDMVAVPGMTEAWVAVIVEYSINCGACHQYIDELAIAHLALQQDFPGKVLIVLVNVDQASDKTILEFAADREIPDGIQLVAGVSSTNAIGGVPETFVFLRDPLLPEDEQWGGVANFKGATGADTIIGNCSAMVEMVYQHLDGK